MDRRTYARHRSLTPTAQQLWNVRPTQVVFRYRLDEQERAAGKIPLDEEEQTQLRGAAAGMDWASRQGRPDVAAAAPTIAASFPEPTVVDARVANATVRRLKEHHYCIV